VDRDSPPDLTTGRLRMRLVEPADAAATARLMTLDVALRLSSWRHPMTVRQAAARISRARRAAAARESVDYAILTRAEGELLGWVGLAVVSDQGGRARLGYWLGTPHQGRGYMSEAVAAALPAAVAFLRVEAVEAAVEETNAASVAILERLGMRRVGDRVEPMRWQGRAAHCVLFRLVFPQAGRIDTAAESARRTKPSAPAFQDRLSPRASGATDEA
jgi:RimJ/RimL family protein N-acetyltransferase